MKDCNFKSLIMDCYTDSRNRIFTKNELGFKNVYGNYFGIVYSPNSTDRLDKIIDINKYIDVENPDMLFLKSRITGKEIEIYARNLLRYEFSEDGYLKITFRNGSNELFKLS